MDNNGGVRNSVLECSVALCEERRSILNHNIHYCFCVTVFTIRSGETTPVPLLILSLEGTRDLTTPNAAGLTCTDIDKIE